MNNNKKEENKYLNDYGEFISSYFKWDTIEKQKEVVNKLENITKNKKKGK